MRFLEIVFGIFLFPIMLILGLVLGIKNIYQIFDDSFWRTVNHKENKNEI